MPIPTAEIQRVGRQVYGTGATSATFYWTFGLVYSTATILADVTGAEVLSDTENIPDAVLNGTQSDSGLVTFTGANSSGNTINIDGWAIVVAGNLHDGGNDVSESVPDGATISTEWTGIVEEG